MGDLNLIRVFLSKNKLSKLYNILFDYRRVELESYDIVYYI